ncbi:hypothetical protein [Homoserinibacter sp. GY 40078]|uniref:hypothetical protein n=1 Tax=Homoserinibacter sp. GY 40078 TaxID=2603275 RepID=UPI0021076F7B|nr:hypothetical protein [Homoserinibacter sp. GY 40078]
MTISKPTLVGLIALLAWSCLAVGATAAMAVGSATPATLAPAATSVEVPVGAELFSDERTVSLTGEVAPELPLAITGSGRVTSFDCAPGTVWASGSRVFRVDGRAVLAVATRTPLWRDLRVGDRGADVAALQKELARLKVRAGQGEVLSNATITAVEKLLGDPPGSMSTIELGRVVWLPRASTELARCATFTGASLAPDEPVAFARRLPALDELELLGGAVDGDRVLRIGDETLPLGADGSLPAKAASVVAASGAYRGALAEGATRFEVQAVVALAEPVEVAAVPPAAIYALDGGSGCVLADGKPVALTVVGSQLGRSFVTFTDADAAPRVVLAPAPTDGPPCR